MPILKAQKRDKKTSLKKIRKEGYVPGVLYGPNLENILVKVEEKEFKKIFKEVGESTLVNLQIEDLGKSFNVLIHDFQKDPISGKILHIDFYLPGEKSKVKVNVPIVFEGESKAVKEKGGVLIKEIQEIEISGPVNLLPKEIKVDLSKLEEIGDKILVKDLILPRGIKILKNPEEIVANVISQEKEEIETKTSSSQTTLAQATLSSQEAENTKEKTEK
jgi:large subunit ribosomal protein L25